MGGVVGVCGASQADLGPRWELDKGLRIVLDFLCQLVLRFLIRTLEVILDRVSAGEPAIHLRFLGEDTTV